MKALRSNDVSKGGLSFKTSRKLSSDDIVDIMIPIVKPRFSAKAKVAWCKKNGKYFNVGVQFLNRRDHFRARMVEQICYIEQYKKKVLKRENRHLTTEEAAREWIRSYAGKFPT